MPATPSRYAKFLVLPGFESVSKETPVPLGGLGEVSTLDQFNNLRKRGLLGKIVCTSGAFDPIRPGHLSCIIESKARVLAALESSEPPRVTLVVIVNGDWWLVDKGRGRPFMDLATRVHVVSCVRDVDYVVPFEIVGDKTVAKALELLKPDVFANGGDRKHDDKPVPEPEASALKDAQLEYNVGLGKHWASSRILKSWGRYWARQRVRRIVQHCR